MKHQCVKCKREYFDNDPDPYYCPTCNEQCKLIAAEIDRKIATQPRKPIKSLLQEYDEAPKVNGFMVIKM